MEQQDKVTAKETVNKLAVLEIQCILCGPNCTCYTKKDGQ